MALYKRVHWGKLLCGIGFQRAWTLRIFFGPPRGDHQQNNFTGGRIAEWPLAAFSLNSRHPRRVLHICRSSKDTVSSLTFSGR